MEVSEIGGDASSSKVFVLHSSEEADIARNMKEQLINRGFNTSIYLDDVLPGSSSVLEISNAIYKSSRCVMIISSNFITDGYLNSGFLWAMDHQNTKRIISCFPVLYGLQKNDLPIEYRHFEYLLYDHRDLYKKLEEEIRNDIKIETRVTHTGVGLAWSYFYGYLEISLPGLESRINECAQFKDTLYPKLIIILPVSCKCPDVMPEKENFRHVGKIDHDVSRAGVHERSYKSTVYDFNFRRSSTKEQVHCHLLIEFATPLLSLHQMNEGKIAQLNKEQMTNERHTFKEVVNQILNYKSMKKCREKYLLIDYRDEDEQTTSHKWTKETLSEVVARAVENDMIAHNYAERYLRPVLL